jgi:hypothetical protein
LSRQCSELMFMVDPTDGVVKHCVLIRSRTSTRSGID